jgi:Cu/Ag efflux protein CusF
MAKRFMPVLVFCLMAATSAHAQYGGGGGGHGGRGGRTQNPAPPTTAPTTSTAPPAKAESSIVITGVIKSIDAENGRVTIAYEDVEALNWPAGTMPFVVSKAALLKDASVGEKVRFKLESQQISELTPY